MAERPGASRGSRSRAGDPKIRSVYFLTSANRLAITARAKHDGVSEAEVVRRALAVYLEAGGLSPGDDELTGRIRSVVRQELAAGRRSRRQAAPARRKKTRHKKTARKGGRG